MPGLTVTRKPGDGPTSQIRIGQDVVVTVRESKPGRVLVNIQAPRDVRVRRGEQAPAVDNRAAEPHTGD